MVGRGPGLAPTDGHGDERLDRRLEGLALIAILFLGSGDSFSTGHAWAKNKADSLNFASPSVPRSDQPTPIATDASPHRGKKG
jgi:hypothetical protein